MFGTYSTSLSLKEAMEKEVVAKANVYRIETNIDLSQVRFNGKDYVNADLEKRVKIDDVLDDYIAFYQDRLRRGLHVDRSTCPYNEEMLKDRKAICRNMLTNPFEKFERKRFLYYSKDLSVISMNHALYSQMEAEDWTRVRTQLQEDLKNYYSEMGGI